MEGLLSTGPTPSSFVTYSSRNIAGHVHCTRHSTNNDANVGLNESVKREEIVAINNKSLLGKGLTRRI